MKALPLGGRRGASKGYLLLAVLALLAVTGTFISLNLGFPPQLRILMVTPVRQLITRQVVVQDRLEPADLVYVLNGNIGVRAGHAAHVFSLGLAPRVVIAHSEETRRARRGRPELALSEIIAAEMSTRGVPRSAIEIIPFRGGVLNTRDEARALRRYLEEHPVRRVIVVTTDHHTGRARRAVRQELRGLRVQVQMAGAPDPTGITPQNWWTMEKGIRKYTEELLKQLATILRIG